MADLRCSSEINQSLFFSKQLKNYIDERGKLVLARINIEDSIESREEFWQLIAILKDRDICLGKLVRFFRLSQLRYGRGESVTKEDLEYHGLEIMITTGWAIKVDGGYQALGYQKQFDWYQQRCIAGQNSAKKRQSNKNKDLASTEFDSVQRNVSSETPLAPALALALKKERESKNKSTQIPSAPSGAPPISLVEIWNQHSGSLPKVKGCASTRLKKATILWRNKPDPNYWQEIIQRIARSKFCQGQNDRSWRATFDFLLQPDTQHKVMEGKYDNPSEASKLKPKSAIELELEQMIAVSKRQMQYNPDGEDYEL